MRPLREGLTRYQPPLPLLPRQDPSLPQSQKHGQLSAIKLEAQLKIIQVNSVNMLAPVEYAPNTVKLPGQLINMSLLALSSTCLNGVVSPFGARFHSR